MVFGMVSKNPACFGSRSGEALPRGLWKFSGMPHGHKRIRNTLGNIFRNLFDYVWLVV